MALTVDFSNSRPIDHSLAMNIIGQLRNVYDKTDELEAKIWENNGKYVLPENFRGKKLYDDFWEAFRKESDAYHNHKDNRTIGAIKARRLKYNADIAPIDRMVETYNTTIDNINKAGPDAIIGDMDKLLDFNNYVDTAGRVTPLQTRSKDNIMKVSAGVVTGLSNAMRSAPKVVGNIAQQYLVLKQQGLNGEDAANTILQNWAPDTGNSYANSQVKGDLLTLMKGLDKVYNQFAFSQGTKENDTIRDTIVTGALMGLQPAAYDIKQDLTLDNLYKRAQIQHTQASTNEANARANYYRNYKNISTQSPTNYVPDGSPVVQPISSDAQGKTLSEGDVNRMILKGQVNIENATNEEIEQVKQVTGSVPITNVKKIVDRNNNNPIAYQYQKLKPSKKPGAHSGGTSSPEVPTETPGGAYVDPFASMGGYAEQYAEHDEQ